MDEHDFRRIALAQPEAGEKAHFGKADFRVRNRIFASLPEPGRGVIKLTPDEQQVMAGAEPAIFGPVKGGWGRQGWTSVHLEHADEATLAGALRTAWANAAPKTLVRAKASPPPASPASSSPRRPK